MADAEKITQQEADSTETLMRLKRIEESLYFAGNGDSIVSKIVKLGDKLDEIIDKIKVFPEMKTKVELHLAEPHLWVLIRSTKAAVIFSVAVIALHTIATYVPNVWNWIVVAVGLPHLKVPLM